MKKIEIKSIFGKLLFEHACEDNTIAKTVSEAVRSSADLSSANLRCANLGSANLHSAKLHSADLHSANLRYADLGSADLGSADLSSANLHSADLSSANLRYADLGSADLGSADLHSADLDKRYISVSCIGSSKRMTTYCFEDDKIWCGCFTGTLEEFEFKCKETHKDNPQYLKEYLGFIGYIKSLK